MRKILIVLLLSLMLAGCNADKEVEKSEPDNKKEVSSNQSDENKKNEEVFELLDTDKKLLQKEYKDLSVHEYSRFNKIDENYSGLEEDIKKEIDRIKQEKETLEDKIKAEKAEEAEKRKEEQNKIEDKNKKEDEAKENQINQPENNRKDEIKQVIGSRINEGDYKKVNIDKTTINDNLGAGGEGTYIALVNLEFEVMNTRKTGNNMMRMYSDDLVATVANKGIKDIAEIAIFWKDEYNNRNVKYSYIYRDNGFYINDVAGE